MVQSENSFARSKHFNTRAFLDVRNNKSCFRIFRQISSGPFRQWLVRYDNMTFRGNSIFVKMLIFSTKVQFQWKMHPKYLNSTVFMCIWAKVAEKSGISLKYTLLCKNMKSFAYPVVLGILKYWYPRFSPMGNHEIWKYSYISLCAYISMCQGDDSLPDQVRTSTAKNY